MGEEVGRLTTSAEGERNRMLQLQKLESEHKKRIDDVYKEHENRLNKVEALNDDRVSRITSQYDKQLSHEREMRASADFASQEAKQELPAVESSVMICEAGRAIGGQGRKGAKIIASLARDFERRGPALVGAQS